MGPPSLHHSLLPLLILFVVRLAAGETQVVQHWVDESHPEDIIHLDSRVQADLVAVKLGIIYPVLGHLPDFVPQLRVADAPAGRLGPSTVL